MLTSNWAWRRRACTWKLLDRIRGEVYMELQASWRIAGESLEGLICTANTSEFAVELGCSTVADLKACTSGNREPILANDHLKDKHMVIV
jgi:metal-dependent HD superfamily phosphatase/phosphodiesterase